MKLIKKQSDRLKSFLPELLEIRRHLHAHPELSGGEYQTAALVARELRNYGWQVNEAIGRTGVIAEIGDCSGPVVGLRVDMDALPIEEKTGLDYSSLNQGIMHACGHDLHTCIGLGVAKLFSSHPSDALGIRILFQPAEEIAKGAGWMKLDGATRGLEALFGVHVFPELPVGKIGVKSGALTAAAGELEIEIIGEAGHGARPHQAVDAIWIASRVVCGLQEAISRRLDALSPVVVTFGRIEGGKAFNVVADRVKLIGTVRYLDPSLNKTLPDWIKAKVNKMASAFDAHALVDYRSIAPPVNNDEKLTDLLSDAAISVLGKENVLQLRKPSLGAEDFAEFLEDVPGTMFRLGVSGANGCAPLHHGKFSPDEKSLEVGILVLAKTLSQWIESHSILKVKEKE